MPLLLKYALLVEPDRQRLSRFVLASVEELGGNSFSSALALGKCMTELYRLVNTQDEALDARLILTNDNKALCLETDVSCHTICSLPRQPSAKTINAIRTRLSQQSEMADPELMRQRNAKISEDLEKAKARAADELSQLEKQLETRRVELEQAQKNAETDSLTGLYNRGAYDIRLQQSMDRCKRQDEPLSLIMIDVDEFKQINDSHGHLYGDEYLKKVANSMQDACRKEVDHCCRTGGDEFAIIVFANLVTTERVAKMVLEKMKNKISMGIAQMLPDDTPETLAERCDSALYEAKENGRGQFVTSHITNVNHKKTGKRN